MASSDKARLWREALIGIPHVDSAGWRTTPLLLRWLIATRASVLPLTGFSVLFAIGLAQPMGFAAWIMAAWVLISLLLAHATNNLLNDYVDYRSGLDQDNYIRARYGVHVLASGLMVGRQFLRYLWFTGLLAAASGVAMCLYRGGWVYAFAGAGAFFVLFYTWPLKRWALGELAVLLTWGPLMVGGTYLVISGEIRTEVMLAGLIYGLGPAVVIFAKHTDKAADDIARGIHTLPSVVQSGLGPSVARQCITALAVMQLAGAAGVALWSGLHGLWGVCLGIPALLRLARVNAQPLPDACPADYPTQAWPLWFTTHAFIYARDAGGGLTLGVLLHMIVQVYVVG